MTLLSSNLQGVELDVIGNPGNPLLHYLDALSTYEPKILSRLDDRGGGEFVIQLASCVRELKLRLITSIIQERCGGPSCRIWKVLLLKQKLDEKQITKLVLMNEKVVRQLLYSLFKIGFVFIQVYYSLYARTFPKVLIIQRHARLSCTMLTFLAHARRCYRMPTS